MPFKKLHFTLKLTCSLKKIRQWRHQANFYPLKMSFCWELFFLHWPSWCYLPYTYFGRNLSVPIKDNFRFGTLTVLDLLIKAFFFLGTLFFLFPVKKNYFCKQKTKKTLSNETSCSSLSPLSIKVITTPNNLKKWSRQAWHHKTRVWLTERFALLWWSSPRKEGDQRDERRTNRIKEKIISTFKVFNFPPFQPTEMKFEFPDITKDIEMAEDEAKAKKDIDVSKKEFKKWVGAAGGSRRGAPPFFGL